MANMSLPLIPVPARIAALHSKTDLYRSLLAHALQVGAAPQVMGLAGVPRASFFLPPALQAKLQHAAECAGMSVQDAFAGLTAAAIELRLAEQQDQNERQTLAPLPPFAGARAEQAQFYQAIQASLLAGRFCLAEASTGVGKGRALVMAALSRAQALTGEDRTPGRVPVVVAAPTLKVLGQLWAEFEALRAQGHAKGLRAAYFPGRTEFVDAARLKAYLESADRPDAAVADWVAAGGGMRPETASNPLARALADAGWSLSWLMEDLRGIATDLPAGDFALREDSEHPDIVPLRTYARQADVLFCTHAMLGRAGQRGWHVFPAPLVLMIDEAHQLEQNLAGIYTHQLSLFSLRHRIRVAWRAAKSGKSSKLYLAVKKIQNLIRLLQELDLGEEQVRYRMNSGYAVLLDPLEDLLTLVQSRVFAGVEGIKQDREIIKQIIEAIQEKARASAWLSFSPDRRFPSFMAGRPDIGSALGHLWATATAGGVLASATLYLPDEFGNQKCDYLMNILSLPRSRTDTPAPVVAPWVRDIPVMHTPTPENAKALARPGRKARTEDLDRAWLAALAERIGRITQQARGGSLVLLTAYQQVEALAAHLEAAGMGDRLLCQRRNERFAVVEQRFRDLHAAGQRPVLLGLGAAWTGVDLRDKAVPASEDTLLTDLIIGCAPIGLNHTSTMQARADRSSVNPVIKEALMTLRQGLGRAVRDADMRDRRIWFLDGRIWQPWPGMETFTRAARRLLDAYPQQAQF